MRYLLDTRVFLWALAAPQKLNRRARELLADPATDLSLSAAGSWEMSIKYSLGRLEMPEPPSACIPQWLRRWGLRPLEITHLHTLAVGDLPPHHHDPFDRLLIVQANLERLTLLTADRIFTRYPVEIFWCGK